MQVIIEKKAKFTMILLSLILIVLLANISLSSEPAFYNTLQQVVRSSQELVSVDLNENNIIDRAELAYSFSGGNFENTPGICPKEHLLKGFLSTGEPYCVVAKWNCNVDEDSRSFVCFFSESESADFEVIEVVFSAAKNTLNFPEEVRFLESFETESFSTTLNYCKSSDTSVEADEICLTEINLVGSNLIIDAKYTSIGASFITDLEMSGSLNGKSFSGSRVFDESARGTDKQIQFIFDLEESSRRHGGW